MCAFDEGRGAAVALDFVACAEGNSHWAQMLVFPDDESLSICLRILTFLFKILCVVFSLDFA